MNGPSTLFRLRRRFEQRQTWLFALVAAFFWTVLTKGMENTHLLTLVTIGLLISCVIIIQKYPTIILAAKDNAFLNGMKQSGAYHEFLDYCIAEEIWTLAAFCVAIVRLLFDATPSWPFAFFAGGALCAFFRCYRLFRRIRENAFGRTASEI